MMKRNRGQIILRRIPADHPLATAYTPYESAIGWDSNGHPYVVCTEGVGRKLDKSELNSEWLTWPTDVIDLADWVREFGGRLESNFWLWYWKLSE